MMKSQIEHAGSLNFLFCIILFFHIPHFLCDQREYTAIINGYPIQLFHVLYFSSFPD